MEQIVRKLLPISFESLVRAEELKQIRTREPHAVAHNGRLLACHNVSSDFFGKFGEKLPELFGQPESDWAEKHAAVECIHPAGVALSAGHALLRCFGGARIRGNKANPIAFGCAHGGHERGERG